MKNRKYFAVLLACALSVSMLLTGCGKKDEAPDASASGASSSQSAGDTDFAISQVKLCATETNHPDFMKGFSMMGTIGDLIDNEDIFSVAMCYTTGTREEVEEFFAGERFADPAGFLAELDALDLDGAIRNLSGDKLSYLDGNVDNPIRFYGDGVDLLSGVSLLQNAGEYHFYLVTMGYEKVLAVAEADRTFTMEQKAIDLSKDFSAAFEVIGETELMTDVADVSAVSQEEKTQAAQDYFASQVDALGLGVTVTVEYDNNPDYPDDYVVTLSKDGAESFDYVSVYFGAE